MPPFLSVVVISHNMHRELLRTLESLSVACQEGIDRDDYEVVLVDNGSRHPPEQAEFAALDLNLTVLASDIVSPSPIAAVNQGLERARGDVIGVWIDGARMASPGLLANARAPGVEPSLRRLPRPVSGLRPPESLHPAGLQPGGRGSAAGAQRVERERVPAVRGFGFR